MLIMSSQEVNGETAFCHLTNVPVLPVRVITLLVFPLQMVIVPETTPPPETGSTVMTATSETSEEHSPLWSTALKWVV